MEGQLSLHLGTILVSDGCHCVNKYSLAMKNTLKVRVYLLSIYSVLVLMLGTTQGTGDVMWYPQRKGTQSLLVVCNVVAKTLDRIECVALQRGVWSLAVFPQFSKNCLV